MHSNRPTQPLLKLTCLLVALTALCGHDLYLKMETYFLEPDQQVTLSLYNGTFEKSENTITRDRMLDASLVAQGQRVAIEPGQWEDQDDIITQVTFTTGEAGTYVAGVSTRPRNIELDAEAFNSYLEHDGVLDMLEQRRAENLLDRDAVESYEKHVKAIYQVGDSNTDDWQTVLGYPIEFVPQANPYATYSGETLAFRLLLDGEPLPGQLVYADHVPTGHSHQGAGADHSHDPAEDNGDHTHTSGQQLRTDDQGMVTVDLPEEGIYFLRTIHMVALPDSEELTHRSRWATLSFEVTHRHDATTHTHDDHDQESAIPVWVLVLGSLLAIGILFLVFREKSA